MPIIPILPANAVKIVRPFLVNKLFNDSDNAVIIDILILLVLLFCFTFLSSSITGSVSLIICPSFNSIILVEYFLAISALWVTIITNLSSATSFNNSIICSLVFESNAPVGSSAKTISGLLTKARAIATLCIWPPDIWFGLLFMWSAKPTFAKASFALFLLSCLFTPDKVSANSTFCKIDWCGIKL